MITSPRILPLLIATLMFHGCGDDDSGLLPGTADGAGIVFVSPDIDSHDATTTLTISDFNVSAFSGYDMLMDNVEVRRTGLNSWQYSPAVEWPGTPVDFFAVSPAMIPLKVNPWERYFEVSDPGLVDVLASVRLGVTQESGRLKLNFAHTMARVAVKLYTSRVDVNVAVRYVSLNDIADFGRFHFPSFSTSVSADREDITPCWAIYNTTGPYRVIYDDEGGNVLSDVPAEMCSTGVRYFLPIQFKPLVTGNYTHGSNVMIVCRLTDPSTGAVVWPDASTPQWQLWRDDESWGVVYVSLADATPGSRWLAGREYVYAVDVYDTDMEASRALTNINCSVANLYDIR